MSHSHFLVSPTTTPLSGEARVPGDKSIGHRAVLFGGLCDGAVTVRGLSRGADNRATVAAVRNLGVSVTEEGDTLTIGGVGVDGLVAAAGLIDCGNAGTAMRLLCGVAAGQPFDTRLVGDESLSNRPMKRVSEPLSRMGAVFSGREAGGNLYAPLTVTGKRPLRAVEFDLPVASAQVKSALLLAGLYADGPVVVREPGPSRDHTERMLRAMGAPIEVRGRSATIDVRGWDRVLSADLIVVPGDPSAAAFAVVAGLIAGADRLRIPGVCVNSTRTGFLDALAAMGAVIAREQVSGAGEPTANLELDGSAELKGARIFGDTTVRAIDELPVLAVAAAFADGETRFEDAAELRVKESDRIATTVAMLRAFGVEVEEREDGFTVAGVQGRTLRAARVDSGGDHRIAMAAAVASLRADGECRIDDTANVGTSFPGFAAHLAAVGASIQELG